uniref:Integrase, catalytic region, zinc finger, CCHC-type, peptidase aspartic, catalytic n=1 Tax=Tanacetum cinerariifolium TaxID=118510 RepID=A0A699KIH8_TANCI|nr:integrase, catalytic region, zinc finger, CCHC-type, peptidase aspartic, catalytic [Tanacetum cinerariifolium]
MITPSVITDGERGFEQTKACYLQEVIPFFQTIKDNFEGIQKALTREVKQMKDVFDELEAEVAQLVTKSELNVARFVEMHVANTSVETRCLALEAELATLRDKRHQENQGELIKHFSKLELTKVTDPVNNLQAQNDRFRAENEKVKQHYKQLYDSIKITRAKHIEQITKLTAENVTLKTSVGKAKVQPSVLTRTKHAVDVELIVLRLRNNRDAHLDYLRHLKESVETIRDIIEEAKVLAHTPLIRKKQDAVTKPSNRQDSNKNKHVVTQKIQKTNVPVPQSTRVKRCPKAGGSQPKSNHKTNRISPAKSDNKLPVEDLPRTNKSHLRTTNHVDSNSRLKRTVINSNFDSICQTCKKFLTSFDHDMCVTVYVKSVVLPHSTRHNCEVERPIKQVWKPKHVARKITQVWKPKHVARKITQVWKPKLVGKVWKPTGKFLTTIGHQWRPTGQTLHLGTQCPLTRFTAPQVVSAAQSKNQANTCANQKEPNHNWGSKVSNPPSLSGFKCKSYRSSFGIWIQAAQNI